MHVCTHVCMYEYMCECVHVCTCACVQVITKSCINEDLTVYMYVLTQRRSATVDLS